MSCLHVKEMGARAAGAMLEASGKLVRELDFYLKGIVRN